MPVQRQTKDSLAQQRRGCVVVIQTDLDLQLCETAGGIPHTAVQTGSSRHCGCICLRGPTEPKHRLGLGGITAHNPYTGNNPLVPKSKQNLTGSSFAGLQPYSILQWVAVAAVAMFMLNLSLLALLVNNQSTALHGLLLS